MEGWAQAQGAKSNYATARSKRDKCSTKSSSYKHQCRQIKTITLKSKLVHLDEKIRY